jgi:lipopolysaccharide/colanic/teichoic acid biosynthesis glycosyltransferase
VAVIAPGPRAVGADVAGVPVCGGLDDVRALAARGIRVALVETDQRLDLAAVDRLQKDFHRVVLLREYDDLPVEGIQIRNLGSVVGIEYTNNLLLHGNRVAKRALDVAIGTLLLIVTAPVLAAAIVLVKVLDGGPVFFTQRRSGLDGEPFDVPKIRTMRVDAEERLEGHLSRIPRCAKNGKRRTSSNRIRASFLRRPLLPPFQRGRATAVVDGRAGRMSLVGPRPFPDYHLTQFPPAFLELRRRVRPGITGCGRLRCAARAGSKAAGYDTYYIRNWSVWLDSTS